MKKTIKKIVSGIASIVLGFSMITSSQVFAKNDDNPVKLECGSDWAKIVPSENGASKMEGMASDGENIYVVKVDKAETIAKIHRYNLKGERVGSGKLPCKVGHANDMTAVKYGENTHLFVLQHNKTTTTIHHFTVEKNGINKDKYTKVTEYIVNGVYNGIAAKVDNNKSNQANCVFYLTTNDGEKLYCIDIDLGNKKKMTLGCYYICDTGICEDYRPQGIAYNKGYMYMAFSEEKGSMDKHDNLIYSFKPNKSISVYTVYTNKKSKDITDYLELESCVVVGGNLYICTNSLKDYKDNKKDVNYDGLYKIKK